MSQYLGTECNYILLEAGEAGGKMCLSRSLRVVWFHVSDGGGGARMEVVSYSSQQGECLPFSTMEEEVV
jgi:hypothetical protein